MKIRKITVLFLVFVITFAIVGCSEYCPLEPLVWNPEWGAEPNRLPLERPHKSYVPLDHEMRDISSWELVKEIQTGWNLGNTFESSGRGLFAERAWGNPRTTFAMIYTVANAGFDSVRIPITWQNHLGDAPYYLICESWLDRIEEVIGYVLTLGMFCIIILHHEDWIITTPEHESYVTEKLIAIWKQLSERFSDYNEKLIFEGINEPRAIGCIFEWGGGTSEDRQVVNRINQAFIDTVRASGGRNELRHLMIPSYAASAEEAAMIYLADSFPQDDDKIIASIHAYTPYYFTLITEAHGIDRWIPHTDEPEIDLLFDRLKKLFLDRGIPVIIGETGARDRGGNLNDRIAWTRYYFGMAEELGIPAFWWDNGKILNSENTGFLRNNDYFGILDRFQAEFVYPEIVDAIMGR